MAQSWVWTCFTCNMIPGWVDHHTSGKGSFRPKEGARVIDKSYRHDCLNPKDPPEYAAYVAPALSARGRETSMAWTTPTLVEICVGLEINGYLPAEF
jgi:coenzyme PQQ precursor peptide PqqA